jgi:hypothetical protein
MKNKDYSLLINKTFKNPNTGKTFKIKNIKADGTVELSEVGNITNIETILDCWEPVTESTLICG